MPQYCAECGKEMAQLESGACLQCCNGYGYWAAVQPEARVRLAKHGEYFLYIDMAKWPKGTRAQKPNRVSL